MIKSFQQGSYKMIGKVIFSCFIVALIILTNNIPVNALNTNNIFQTTAVTSPGQGSGWYKHNNDWYYKSNLEKNGEVVVGYIVGD